MKKNNKIFEELKVNDFIYLYETGTIVINVYIIMKITNSELGNYYSCVDKENINNETTFFVENIDEDVEYANQDEYLLCSNYYAVIGSMNYQIERIGYIKKNFEKFKPRKDKIITILDEN